MVKHIVCYKMKEPSEELFKATKEIFLSMKGRVPELRDIAVGVDALHSARSYDMVLETVFDDFAAMESYQRNEYHVNTVKKHMHAIVDKSVSVDYEF